MTTFRTKQAKAITADLGSLTGAGTRKNSVGAKNKSDLFQFSMPTRSSFSAALTGLKANADLTLLDSNRTFISTSHNRGKKAEQISTTLGSGTYYIKVNVLKKGSTPFTLSYNTTPDGSANSGTGNPGTGNPGTGKTVGLTDSEYATLTKEAQNAAFDYYFYGIPAGYARFTEINNQLLSYVGQGDSSALEYYKLASMAEIDAQALGALYNQSFNIF